jgi:hypothetical protein
LGVEDFIFFSGLLQGYLCHSRGWLISERKHRFHVYIKLSFCFKVSPHEAVDMLISLWDKDTMVHFRNVVIDSYFLLSETQNDTEQII